MENLLCGQDEEKSSRILDIPPIKEIEKIYNKINRFTFSIVVLLHITYMGLFSYAGIEISKEFRHNPINITSSSFAYVLAYTVVPMEPLIFIVYSISFIKTNTSNIFSKTEFLIVAVNSIIILFWLVLITEQDRDQDYLQAGCLFYGWIFTIYLASGFKSINIFWKMLNMVFRNVVECFTVYICLLLAIALALHTLFQISSSIAEKYPTVGDTLFLLFNIMLGMGELFDDNFESGMSTAGRSASTAKGLYVIYLLLATIGLLNVLIAMMNETFSRTLAVQKCCGRVEALRRGIGIARLSQCLPKMFSKIEQRRFPGGGRNVR